MAREVGVDHGHFDPSHATFRGQQHFVGNETDRRWEFGDDLSVVRSKSMEYRPRTTVADAKLREEVAAASARALMRATRLSQHTLEAIRTGRRVRGASIRRVIAALRK